MLEDLNPKKFQDNLTKDDNTLIDVREKWELDICHIEGAVNMPMSTIMETFSELGLKEGGVVSLAEGGMLDFGGKEMDLRGGGFVPIGKKEKADDVPARLSKNEFVMTADAVRAAGGGSVNKGAQRMYDLMNNLEARA